MHETRVGGLAEGAHVHIVHLSDSRTSLDLIKVCLSIYILSVNALISAKCSMCACRLVINLK